MKFWRQLCMHSGAIRRKYRNDPSDGRSFRITSDSRIAYRVFQLQRVDVNTACAGRRKSYSAKPIVVAPNGAKRTLGRLGDFGSTDEACQFAIECRQAAANGQDYRRLFNATGRPVPTAKACNIARPKGRSPATIKTGKRAPKVAGQCGPVVR
jgi:hypothetical protein